MRLLALAATLALATPALAQQAIEEPYAPYKLVGVMPDTGQVLLWDDTAGEYRLARAGEDLGGWKVSGLDLKDARGPRVALQREDLIDELELVRLPRPGAVIVFKDRGDNRAVAVREEQPPPSPAPAPAFAPAREPARELPGATIIQTTPLPPSDILPEEAAAAPFPPAAPPAPAPAVVAPAPAVVAPAPPPTSKKVGKITPTVINAPTGDAPPAAILEETRGLPRSEFDREINDFDSLMASATVDRAEGGGFVFTRLEPRSWLGSLGFKEGDVVRNVAGERVSSVEDAARVYSRLRNLPSFTAEVQRGGTWVHLKFVIKDK